MKRSFLILILIFLIAISLTWLAIKNGFFPYIGIFEESSKDQDSAVLGFDAKSVAFSELSKPLYMEPIKISFQDQTLSIVKVGVASDQTLEAPTDWFAAGWYHKSAKAGEEGNIIIDGHYDTNTGAPAAFWGLKNLKVNDTVVLVDSSGKEFSYRIEDTFYVDINDPERTFIFEEVTGKSELTLITCGGVWDTVKGTYDKRLVVKASLVSN